MVIKVFKLFKVTLVLITLFASSSSFSKIKFSNKVSEIVIAKIKNSLEPILYRLDAGLNENGDIISFIKKIIVNGKVDNSLTVEYPLTSLKMGILVQKLGFKVLMYDPTQFNPYSGGIVTIFFANDFIKSRFSDSAYKKVDVELKRVGTKWVLLDRSKKEINYMYFSVKKNFLGIASGISKVKLSKRN